MKATVPESLLSSGLGHTLLSNVNVVKNLFEFNRIMDALSQGKIEDVRKISEDEKQFVIEVKYEGAWHRLGFSRKKEQQLEKIGG